MSYLHLLFYQHLIIMVAIDVTIISLFLCVDSNLIQISNLDNEKKIFPDIDNVSYYVLTIRDVIVRTLFIGRTVKKIIMAVEIIIIQFYIRITFNSMDS